MRRAPSHNACMTRSGGDMARRLSRAGVTEREAEVLDAFGLFVTFTSYLPAYLSNAYDVSTDRAADVMAAFVLLAVVLSVTLPLVAVAAGVASAAALAQVAVAAPARSIADFAGDVAAWTTT